MSVTAAFEGRLNVLLSEVLNESGLVSKAELIGSGRRDVVVYHNGLVCVIEGAYSKVDAERDAIKRIQQLNADIALAVYYSPNRFPQDITEKEVKRLLKHEPLLVRVIVPEDISGTLLSVLHNRNIIARALEDWYELDVNSLVILLQNISEFLITKDSIIQLENEVNELISGFVEYLTNHRTRDNIARNLYSILYELYGFSIGRIEDVKEAVFAQSILAILLSSIYYESIRYAHGLNSIINHDNPQESIYRAFKNILEIDYRPIFEVSKTILNFLPVNEPSLRRLFNRMFEIIDKVTSRRVLLKRDFAGRVYHRVVGEWSLKKGLATYFTQIPSAYLLAYLARPTLSRICDFACGSGTLLTACYSAAGAHYRRSLIAEGIDKSPHEIERDFHRKFISMCYGFDVLSYATQITAMNLALHSSETPLEEDNFKIYTLPLGVKGYGKSLKGPSNRMVSLGSLELARKEWLLWEGTAVSERMGLREKQERLLQELRSLGPFDFIIMNPPFTRATGRKGKHGGGLFGFISDANVRAAVIKKFKKFRDEVRKELLESARSFMKGSTLSFLLEKSKESSSYQSIGQAGEGLLFLYLADLMIRPGGKISFVVPKNILSSPTWFLARVLLASKYHLETVVVSYDSQNGYNFSESTNLSECLLVARRTEQRIVEDKTRFIILLKKPETVIEAIGLANAAVSPDNEYIECGKSQAFLVTVERRELESCIDNWGVFVCLPNPVLLKQVKDLLSGVIQVGNVRKKVPFTRLNNLIVSIGIDRHQFSDNFRLVSRPVPGSKKVLYGGDEEIRRKMEVTANAEAIEKRRGLFDKKAGKLLLPDRIRIDTAHVISMYSHNRVLSNIFYALRLKEESDEKLKALCVWFNTTWGILTVLANKQETEGGWISMKMSQWRLLPVLDVNALSKQTLEDLSNVFERFKETDLGRIPSQYNPGSCNIRKELDMEFLKAVGITVMESDLLDLYKEIFSSMKLWLGNH